MEKIHDRLSRRGIPLYLESFSALDRYFGLRDPGTVYFLTDSTLIALAQAFDELKFPGLPYEDVWVIQDDERYVFRCVDTIENPPSYPFTAQNLIYSVDRDAFLDPRGVYRDLRLKTLVESNQPVSPWVSVMDAAKLVSRYHYGVELPLEGPEIGGFEPTAEAQRDLLLTILHNRFSAKGLSLLYRSGFVEKFWPELFEMGKAQHSKEYHPEGNVWEHSLETLGHRKKRSLILSLSCLLHDVGKPVAKKLKDKPFKDHAEISARISASFLRYLGFSSDLIKDVCFLVRYHMLPSALKKLPLYRIEKLMNNRLFPELLELYRADLSSTFRSPEGYYEACRVHKNYLKKKANPYRALRRGEPVG